jgi:ferredoxin
MVSLKWWTAVSIQNISQLIKAKVVEKVQLAGSFQNFLACEFRGFCQTCREKIQEQVWETEMHRKERKNKTNLSKARV